MKKTLVIYHYYQKDISYRDNFLHFLTFGYSKECDYIVALAGPHTLDLPSAENISYIFTENLGNDFGGYCHVINSVIDINKYEFFFFINSSVRGPFLTALDHNLWTEYFIEQLKPDVGIVGATINILPMTSPCSISYSEKYGHAENHSHIQSTSYLLPRRSLLYLVENGFFHSPGIPDKEDAIRDYEVRLSQLIKERGWNLKSLLPEYNQIDYRIPHIDINPTSDQGDPCFKDGYFGRTIHPNEIIFIKTNRNIYDLSYLDRLACSMLASRDLTKEDLKCTSLDAYRSRINLAKTSKIRLSFIPLNKAYLLLLKRIIRRIRGKNSY